MGISALAEGLSTPPNLHHAPTLLGPPRRWVIAEPKGHCSSQLRLADEPLHPLTQRILAARGILDPALAGPWLDPKLTRLHDPSRIPDLDRAALRLLQALQNSEPIAIFGDYDVDGVCGTAILFHILRALNPNADLRTYVPDRVTEGYGLNSAAVTALASAGARVIVSVDCGITAREPALAARDAGADLIITDHHHPPASMDDLPAAFAVVHPRRPDSTYPFGSLCGAGVAYKLAWRLAVLHSGGERTTPPLRALLLELIAFAALGTVADVVPLVDENRVIARHGLTKVRTTRFEGLRALVEASGLSDSKISELDVGFKLGPRLNACGRLGHAREAVELFTTARGERAHEIARTLSTLNTRRREVEQTIVDAACAAAEAAGMTAPGCRAIVLAHDEWHKGVVGIVCSRLVERFGRPTILMQRSEGVCHGSGRSIEGFNLHAALEACQEHLSTFGGHEAAAGLSLHEHRLEGFTRAFLDYAAENLTDDDLIPRILIDAEAELDELSAGAVAQIQALEPFGPGNPRVRVLLRNLKLAQPPVPLGSKGRGIALTLRRGRWALRTVAWGWGDRADRLREGMTLDAVVTPALSVWGSRVLVEPEIVDLRPSAG